MAQEAPGETQAIRCSALAYIHTNLTSPPAFNVAMGKSAEFYGGVFAAFQEERTGAGATNGEVSLRRDGVEAELRRSWRSRPAIIVSEMALCNTWRAEFAPRIGAANGAIRSGKQIVEIVGAPPSEPAEGEVEKWRPLVSERLTRGQRRARKQAERAETKSNANSPIP